MIQSVLLYSLQIAYIQFQILCMLCGIVPLPDYQANRPWVSNIRPGDWNWQSIVAKSNL